MIRRLAVEIFGRIVGQTDIGDWMVFKPGNVRKLNVLVICKQSGDTVMNTAKKHSLFVGKFRVSQWLRGLMMTSVLVGAAEAQDLAWTPRANMLIPKADFGVATVGKKLYAIGGFSGSTLNTVEEYDSVTNSWTSKAPMPTPRRNLAVVEVNGKIYAIGGMDFVDTSSVAFSSAVEEFDPVKNSWTKKATVPIVEDTNYYGDRFLSAAAANGKIYVMLFDFDIPGRTVTFQYDPASDSWDTSKAAFPFSAAETSAVSLNGKIYVLASQDYGDSNGRLAEYDPVANIWTLKATAKVNRGHVRLVAADGRLYAIGGVKNFPAVGASPVVEEYDPVTDTWSKQKRLSLPRSAPALGTINGDILALGGFDAAGIPTASVETTTAPIHPAGPRIGGQALGIQLTTVKCENLTTGQTINVTLGERKVWNCKKDGLTVSSGDEVRQTVLGLVK